MTDNIDITDLRRVEDALHKSEKRYKALAEMAEDPIYILSRSGSIIYVNTFGAAYFNKKPADVTGTRLPDYFPSKVASRMMKNINKVFRTGKSVFSFGEYEFHGSKFWLDTRLSPITDDSGKVVHVISISRDVTSHRLAEEVLERDKRELERLIRINSQKLLDAQKKLDRAGRLAELGQLSATVAHELRSPLAAIGIAVYNIRTKNKDPRLNNNIRNIEIKVLESDQIIKNLLLYSSIKSPIRETVKLYDLLDECIDLVQSIFSKSKIKIRRTFKCPNNIVVEADPVQLQEVFNNILNNACESFRNKKGIVDIEVSMVMNNRLKIVFKDNGPGMRAGLLKHIFEPFNTTKAKGTGLGLPVCKQIINLHNGEMDISSSYGKGTNVTIYLPININRSVTEKNKK